MIKRLLGYIFILSLSLTFLFTGCAKKPTPPEVSLQSQPVKGLLVYFPRAGQDPAPVLVGLYSAAQKQIDVAIYSLTRADVVRALVDAQNRGVKVRVITDREEVRSKDQKGEINALINAGIPVKENTHPGLMHIKMSVVDGTVATTGSYNYTWSASERNDEMFVVVRDPGFVTECQKEFNTMWGDGWNFR